MGGAGEGDSLLDLHGFVQSASDDEWGFQSFRQGI